MSAQSVMVKSVYMPDALREVSPKPVAWKDDHDKEGRLLRLHYVSLERATSISILMELSELVGQHGMHITST